MYLVTIIIIIKKCTRNTALHKYFFYNIAATYSGVLYYANLGCVRVLSYYLDWNDARTDCRLLISGDLATFHPQTGHQDLQAYATSMG